MTSTVLTDVLKAKTTNGVLTISGNGTGNVDMKNLATTDDTPMVLTLKTGETDIAVDDVLGQIDFQAPDETTGTDAILVAAGIAAISEGDFSSSNNATKLSFKTAASAAAAETASLSSTGVFTATSFTGSGAGLTAGTTPITTLDIDGGTDIGAAVVAADLFVVDDGAGGTNRKTTAARIKTFVEATAVAVTGNVTATGTVEPAGDTAAGDNSALGYTSVLGAILTGQGSTNDVTLVNDADATVLGIATGTTNVDIVGDLTAGTLNADGDTAAGDNAAIGYTAGEGLILTGQGSTNDVTIKNDADADVITIPTGATGVVLAGALTLGGAVAGADQTLGRVNLKDYGEVTNAIGGTGGGTQDIDLTAGNNVTATVDTSTNTFTFSNPTASDELCGFTLFLTNGGSQTVNWPGSVDWAGATAPTLTTSGLDILVFITTDGGTIWHGMVASADSS